MQKFALVLLFQYDFDNSSIYLQSIKINCLHEMFFFSSRTIVSVPQWIIINTLTFLVKEKNSLLITVLDGEKKSSL